MSDNIGQMSTRKKKLVQQCDKCLNFGGNCVETEWNKRIITCELFLLKVKDIVTPKQAYVALRSPGG
jgi:hypothetical protein